eukprot:3227211-Pyramimonas_sp.AAC.1
MVNPIIQDFNRPSLAPLDSRRRIWEWGYFKPQKLSLPRPVPEDGQRHLLRVVMDTENVVAEVE